MRDAAFSHAVLYGSDKCIFSRAVLHSLHRLCHLLLFLFTLENSLFFHNARSNMWLVNTQAGEELCLGS